MVQGPDVKGTVPENITQGLFLTLCTVLVEARGEQSESW